MGSAALLLCLAATAEAQYFGRNKVQYDRDDVRVLATDHFDIYYLREDTEAAVIAGRLAERWYARLSSAFDHTLTGRQPIVLYGSHRRFEQTNIHSGLIDESTGGFTESRKRRIVLPFAKSLAETDHVLGHEIVHAFQFDIADRHRSPLAVPLWFVEGMAEYLTLGRDDRQTAMWMTDAVGSGKLPEIDALDSSRYFPYRWGAALWSYLTQEHGEDLPARALRARRDVSRRLQQTTGRSTEELSAAWHESLRQKYGTPTAGTEIGAPLISSREGGGRLNLASSLSPDGRRIIFLSERDQFSIDLFLADAATGRTIRKLITTAASAEFESLQYLHSAGAWDRAGARFALATIKNGRPALLIMGIEPETDTRELPLPDVDEAYSPTWSPDGRSLALSAMKGGVTDLFIVDVPTGGLRRLTDDAYADLQPAWSPDGQTIAFTTDRFTTSLTRLAFGDYRIGLLDVGHGAGPGSPDIAMLPAIDGANQLDPAWCPSGSSVYFVADPGGVSNVYRIDRASGSLFRVTDVETGVSGVTRVSPALSVAAGTGALAFSVFRNSGYEVHTIKDPELISGVPIERARIATSGSPNEEPPYEILPVPPLPAPAVTAPRARSYQPRLALEAVGSPYFSAGGGPLGSYVAGGVSLLFGDLLGDQQLMTAVYVSSRFDESAFGALYVNRRSRWNWGLALEQTPQVQLRTNSVSVDPDRERIVTRDRDRLLWTNRHVGFFAAYPLNRSRRIELSTGFRQISFERERRIELVSTVTGRMVEHETYPLPGEPSVGIADAGVAFIGDTAVFGATGPMLGSRYRFQSTLNVGGLSYASVLADYRRYLMPIRPYTVALRVVHSGRYGGDAGDFRLRDAYVGSATLVRGYGASTVLRAECPLGSANCPALNSLLANRVVAAKLELRVPLWSTITSSSRVRYGPLPVDAFLFADAGAGWGGQQRFGPGGIDGRLVRSVGAGIRANVVGLIAELAAVKPLDLRRTGWTFVFNLRPGF
jgi:Tol biopolymer transport system component